MKGSEKTPYAQCYILIAVSLVHSCLEVGQSLSQYLSLVLLSEKEHIKFQFVKLNYRCNLGISGGFVPKRYL